MGCCATKSMNINQDLKKSIENMNKSFFRSLTMNRRTIKKQSTGTLKPSHTEIEHSLLIDKKVDQSDIEQIKKALKNHFLFKTIGDENLHLIINEMKCIEYKSSTVMFNQGDTANYFYLISSGSVEIIVNDVSKSVLSPNDCFGELALLYDSTRTATIRTIEDSVFWIINRETFREAVKSVSNSNTQETENFLQSLEFFKNLSVRKKELFLSQVSCMDFNSQNIVIENDPGDMIYIIKSGQVKCSIKKATVRLLENGDLFGEQAAIYGSSRTATVKSVGKSSILAFSGDGYLKFFKNSLRYLFKNSLLMAFELNFYLKDLKTDQMVKLIDKFNVVMFEENDEVIQTGTVLGKAAFVVLKGKVSLGEKAFERNDFIGLENLVNKNLETVGDAGKGLSKGVIGFIYDTDVISVFGESLEVILQRNEIIKVLNQISIFKPLPNQKLEQICDIFLTAKNSPGQVLIEQGQENEVFFIVKTGQICLLKDGELVKSLSRFGYFGEKCLIKEDLSEYHVKSLGNSEIWILSKQEFQSKIDANIIKQLSKRLSSQNIEIELKNLNLIKSIGEGSYGNVFLVHHPIFDKLYALKTVLKSTVESLKIYELILMEKRVLQEIDHPFIIKIIKTFKDSYRFYLLIEYIQGVEFFDVMVNTGLFRNQDIRFYSACIVIMLEHLYERNIMHRDLKPENLIVDNEGYLVLVDFGASKLAKERSYTLIGTPHYMAPEVIKGTGYFMSPDYWSLGVLIYECLVGSVPFGQHEDDLYLVYKSIISKPLSFPKKFNDIPARPLIEDLLQIDPEKRLNTLTIKKHPYYIGINWDYLLGKFVKPPFIPKLEQIDLSSGQPIEDIIDLYESCTLYEESSQVNINENLYNDF